MPARRGADRVPLRHRRVGADPQATGPTVTASDGATAISSAKDQGGRSPHVSETEVMSTTYATRVGERLRVVRKQKRMSLQAVEAASNHEFKASVLGAYERGERAISVPRLQRLARFYNVPVDQLLPRDLGPEGPSWAATNGDGTIDLREGDMAPATARPADDGRVSLDLGRLEALAAPERELLNRYIGMIQLQRQDFNGQVLTIRQEDLRAIACLFEATSEGMRRRLDQLGLIQNPVKV